MDRYISGTKNGSIVFYVIIALVLLVAVIIWYIIAKNMERSAAAKGWGREAHVFGIVFLTGVFGCIYVIALADKTLHEQNKRIINCPGRMNMPNNENTVPAYETDAKIIKENKKKYYSIDEAANDIGKDYN